ncbi:MAG TPA: putative porin, partial [Terriglobales bacterium]|nr:putative porin [Terriglobales bacterium]
MRQFLWVSSFMLVISVAAAQTGAPVKAAAKKSNRARVSANQVQELRDALAAQQKQVEEQRQQLDQLKSQLQQLLDGTQQSSAAVQRVQGSAEQAQTTASQAQQSSLEAQHAAELASANATQAKTALSVVETKSKEEDKKLNSMQDLLGRFRFVGDIRVRGESFFQDGVADRNRGRVRIRFGVDGKLNEDFVGGFALATGSLGDPTTTNETFTNFFDRKTIGLDRGYITYNPLAHKWLSLTGGKFAYAWNRTQVTGDPDINPEGFNEKFSWDLKTPGVKNFTVQFMQLLFNEATGGTDSYALGGQVSGKLQLGRLTTTPSFMAIKWNNPDSILQASAFSVQATTTTGAAPVPGEGPGCGKGSGLPTVPPCAFAANGLTNATYNDPSG